MSKISLVSSVNNTPRIGAHVSAAISLEFAFDKAQKIGAECLQFFVSPPQQWAFTTHDNSEIERFKSKSLETQIGPNFIHGTYLVNLGTDNPEHLKKSIDWLIYGMKMAEKLGIKGVIFHPGSHKGRGLDGAMDQIVGAIKQIMSHIESDTNLILETSAGAGGSIGRDFAELGKILTQAQDNRVKVCIDTAHTFAAGYDWRSNIDEILDQFDQEVGLQNLAAFHANDSKMDIGSFKDRHANIGEGFMGQIAFAQLLNHPKLVDKPFILEVPGFADEGPDKENIEIMKKLRN
jgi:deoxyribonuclease-4